MPSTITSVKSDSPPRVKSDVTVPGPPFCCSVRPGTDRSADGEHELLLGLDLGAGNHGDAVGRARQRLIDLRRRDDQRFGDRADVQRDVERRRRGGDVDRHRVADESRRAGGDAILARIEFGEDELAVAVRAGAQRCRRGAGDDHFRIGDGRGRQDRLLGRSGSLRSPPAEITNNEERITKERIVRMRGRSAAVMVASRASRALEMD